MNNKLSDVKIGDYVRYIGETTFFFTKDRWYQRLEVGKELLKQHFILGDYFAYVADDHFIDVRVCDNELIDNLDLTDIRDYNPN